MTGPAVAVATKVREALERLATIDVATLPAGEYHAVDDAEHLLQAALKELEAPPLHAGGFCVGLGR